MLSRFFYIVLFVSIFLLSCTDRDSVLPSRDLGWQKISAVSDQVNALFRDANNNIWIGTASRGVYRYDGNTYVNFDTTDGLGDNNVLSIAEGPPGTMWFGTNSGLSVYDGQWISFDNISGTSFWVGKLLFDSNDLMWMSTSVFGLWSYEENVGWNQHWDNSCMDCNSVNTIYEDSNGTLWLGTQAGLVKYKNNNRTYYTMQNGLPDDMVTSLEEDSWGRLWIGTINGEDVGIMKGTDISTKSLLSGYPANPVYTIEEDLFGNIWMGLLDYFPTAPDLNTNGIITYDGAVMRTLLNEGPRRSNIFALLEEGNATMWVGAEDGLWTYTYTR